MTVQDVRTVPLEDELRRACKGRAMRDTDPAAKLGPTAMAAFGLEPGEPAATIRHKARERISRLLADDEPYRQRTVALAVLALSAGADQRQLGDRINYLAAELALAPTTVRRHARQAIRQLVDALSGQESGPVCPPNDGFVLRRFRALLRLDRPRPELHETRTVEVSADRLDGIPGRFTLPGGGTSADIEIRAVSGVTGVRMDSRKAGHFRFTLDLARPLVYGETFEYQVVFTIPAGQPMRPHFVFQPLVPCDWCELAVQFDPGARPQRVWLIDGESIRVLDEDEPDLDAIDLGPRIRWRRTFPDTRQGYAYGIKWRPATGP